MGGGRSTSIASTLTLQKSRGRRTKWRTRANATVFKRRTKNSPRKWVKTRCFAPTRKTPTRLSLKSKASRARTTVSAKCRSPAVTNALGEIRRKRTVLVNNRSESFLCYDHTCFFVLVLLFASFTFCCCSNSTISIIWLNKYLSEKCTDDVFEYSPGTFCVKFLLD